VSDYYKLDIRVGKIVQVVKHHNADSLYVEQIDLGETEPRQVVSGLVKFVPEEEMMGALVLVIVNLAEADMRGVKSQGMVLCAKEGPKGGEKVELLKVPKDTPVGSRVFLDGDEEKLEEYAVHAKDIVKAKDKNSAWAKVAPCLKTNEKGVATCGGVPMMLKRGAIVSNFFFGAPIS